MTQDDKDLLLQDLCARLPYGVKVESVFINTDLKKRKSCGIEVFDATCILMIRDGFGEFKPYLFPLSSMTEEMLEELNTYGVFKYRDTIANVSHLENNGEISKEIYTYIDIESISALIEFFHSHHIDYRGLIEKGLAIDATGLNIY